MIGKSGFGGDSTDLSGLDASNISGLVLHVPGSGRISFSQNVNLSGGGDLADVVSITPSLITVNSLLEPGLNRSATLVFENQSFDFLPVILRDGVPCVSSVCSGISYAGGNVTVDVTHFSSYAVAQNAQLAVWDDTDPEGGSLVRNILQNVTFVANYTNTTSGAVISGASCSIDFGGSPAAMSYQAGSGTYTYVRTFSLPGAYEYTVECNGSGQGYEVLNATDEVMIDSLNQWWNESWSHCQNIEIENVQGVDLSSYPMYVNLTRHGAMRSDLADARFLSRPCFQGGVLLDHEVELVRSAAADVWVELSELPADGTVISVYYGNAGATSAENGVGTWNADFAIVYHMNATGFDSTANNRDRAADVGTPGADDTVLGYGRAFSGSNAWSMADIAFWEAAFTSRTHEVVFTTSSDVVSRQLLWAEGGTSNGADLYIYNNYLYAYYWTSSALRGFVNTSISANTQYHSRRPSSTRVM
ncbi:MAG: hypothetical protein HC945_00265 [Nitrosarchaeum sp.]|nr:hypothetical protein [Nitrosarchaeum sp.]